MALLDKEVIRNDALGRLADGEELVDVFVARKATPLWLAVLCPITMAAAQQYAVAEARSRWRPYERLDSARLQRDRGVIVVIDLLEKRFVADTAAGGNRATRIELRRGSRANEQQARGGH